MPIRSYYRYCYKIPDNYPLASAAPLLCAGITVYAPMMRHKMNQPGKSLGVIGLGGLGHMAVKFGKAFGLNVTIFSTSISKKEEALSQLGADKFVVSSDQEQMKVKQHKFSHKANLFLPVHKELVRLMIYALLWYLLVSFCCAGLGEVS